jgi:hypothetical protein
MQILAQLMLLQSCNKLSKRKEKKHGNHPDCHPDPHGAWRSTKVAPQQGLGILSQRRPWIDSFDSDHPSAPWADIKERLYSNRNDAGQSKF